MTSPASLLPLLARRGGPLQGSVRVPGDKSISHRALILGALAIGHTRISGLLEGDDVLRTASAVRTLGADVVREGPGHWSVHGLGVGGWREPDRVLDHGNSGTGVRLTMGAVATTPISVTFMGDASLHRRPMRRVLEPLARFGAEWAGRAGGLLPLTLKGRSGPTPGRFEMTVASAQVKSAILLAALNAAGDTTVVERQSTRDHTERMLRHFGAELTVAAETGGGSEITLKGLPHLKAAAVQVPGDPSSAAFALVAALLVPGSEVTIEGALMNPGRTGLITTLQEMGAVIRIENRRALAGEGVADLTASYSELKGVTVPAERAPSMIDEYPILAIAAANAAGRTVMLGLDELKVKESDRLGAIAAGLAQCGAELAVEGDSLTVMGKGPGGLPGGATVSTHMDHRIAMAFLIAGLASKAPVAVDDTSMIATSFPDFEALMMGLGAVFESAAS